MKTKGYTLLELILVMAIIAALAGLFMTSYPASQRRSRDTVRRSDLKQYQIALEAFATSNNNFYPSLPTATGERMSTTLCTELSLASSSCPEEPRNTNYYLYQSNGSGVGNDDATNYVLWVQLEQPESPVTYYVVCSNGLNNEVTSGIPPGASPASPGDCPF
jgi:prepilin-type N-terminal cleavage/methylation domain-containing protein